MFAHKSIAVFIFTLLISTASYAKAPQGTGLLMVQAGMSRAADNNALSDTLDSAQAIRVKLFGGMKLDIPLVSAAGLGLDLTFHEYKLKEGIKGHYNRMTWDWFYLPVQIGFITVTPGLGWNVIDIKVNSLGISEQSIRPHAMIDVGLSLALMQNAALTLNYRYEKILDDRETDLLGNTISITGDHASVFAGAMVYF